MLVLVREPDHLGFERRTHKRPSVCGTSSSSTELISATST